MLRHPGLPLPPRQGQSGGLVEAKEGRGHTDTEAEAEAEVELPAPSHDNAIIGARLLEILSAERANGILGAQLPSKYLTIYGEPLQVNEPFLPHLTKIFTCLNCAPAGD